jgi:hypothetical protein
LNVPGTGGKADIESVSFRMSFLPDPKAGGMNDILIALTAP